MSKIKDITGKRFGKLVVIKFDHIIKGSSFWECLCDCGKTSIVSKTSLNSGTKSCGCNKNQRRLLDGENAFNRLYDTYRFRAKHKNFEFEFTKDEFKNITKQNCFYCGIKPSQIALPTINFFGEYIYNGIDRVDNSKGYTKENSVPCCGKCNRSKREFSKEEFFSWIKRVYNNIYGEKQCLAIN